MGREKAKTSTVAHGKTSVTGRKKSVTMKFGPVISTAVENKVNSGSRTVVELLRSCTVGAGSIVAAAGTAPGRAFLVAPFRVRRGKGLEFWSHVAAAAVTAAGVGRCCPVGSFRQCCDESLPSWVATRFSGRLHESRSFSGPLSSPPSPTSSSPLPFGSKFCVARR
uniref:Uncharacterized protein n=1 Tax=Anopheles farauti TaxID=69004 RepID=A0A182QK47_9DIPT